MRNLRTTGFVLHSLAIFACNESSFKAMPAPVPEPVVKAAEEALTSAVDAGDSGAPKPVPVPEPSKVEDLGSITDKHTISLKVDIVFGIDTSASMDDELINTQNNIQKMITTLSTGKLDHRIHLLLDQAMTLPAGTDPTKVAYVRQRIDSGDAISRLNNLFAGQYAASYMSIMNAPMATPMAFRKDAKLEIVVITDDNGSGDGNLAANFDPNKTLKATFNGIIGLPNSAVGDNCDLAGLGTEYSTLAAASGGTTLDLCATDWSALITRLSTDMVKRSVTFSLSKKPNDPKNMNVRIAGTLLAAADWTYDAQKNAVTLIKTDQVKDTAELSINYNPAG